MLDGTSKFPTKLVNNAITDTQFTVFALYEGTLAG
jgi:hypothetical protein